MSNEQQTLEWIPRSVRTRLDACALRISLKQWQALPLPARALLVQTAAGEATDVLFRGALDAALTAADAGPARLSDPA